MQINDHVIGVIKSDPFAREVIDGARLALLSRADWSSVNKNSGLPAMDCEEEAIVYNGLSMLVGGGLPKGVEKLKVNVGGQMVEVGTLLPVINAVTRKA